MYKLRLMVESLSAPVGDFVNVAGSWHVSNELLELTVAYSTSCKQASLCADHVL